MSVLRNSPENRTLEELLEFGIVNLDKPAGPSAHQVSAWVSDITGVSKAAHAGTLDPKVTGVLPIMLASATRIAPVLVDSVKTYVAILELHGDPLTPLDTVISQFETVIFQKPPKKSAVSRQLRTREVYDLCLLDTNADQALLSISCESGTYIRKLCHDIGLAAGCGAHMGELRRVSTGCFDDSELVSTAQLTDAAVWRDEAKTEHLERIIDPAEIALAPLPGVTIAPSAAESVATGAPVYAPGVMTADKDAQTAGRTDLLVCYTPSGTAVCLGRRVGSFDSDRGEVVQLERVLI
jgi:tRNA pseudouridine55 synthase